MQSVKFFYVLFFQIYYFGCQKEAQFSYTDTSGNESMAYTGEAPSQIYKISVLIYRIIGPWRKMPPYLKK